MEKSDCGTCPQGECDCRMLSPQGPGVFIEDDPDAGPPVLPRQPGIRLSRKMRLIGPKDDPYELVTRTVEFASDNRRVTMETDSLGMAHRLSGDNLGVEEADFMTEESARIWDEFMSLTGLDAYSFDAHYFGEGGEGYEDPEIIAAERAAGWDPNP